MVKRSDKNQPEIVAALRAVGAVVQDTHELGKGFPDLVVACHGSGSTFVAEIKMPGEGLNEREFEWRSRWPGTYYIWHTIDEALSDFEFENLFT